MKKIFISYSWDSEQYSKCVIDFANGLINIGYDVHIDKGEMQKEYAIDLLKMMHQNITDADKVIVLLSKGYKVKAETFSGGVGQEYKLILTDMPNNRKKYLLASLDDFNSTSEIAPLDFQSKYIFKLSDNGSKRLICDAIEDKLSYGVNEIEEGLHISSWFLNEIYSNFLSIPTKSYLDFLANAGRVYERITEVNIKVGNWSMEQGWDHICTYYIACEIKLHYDNKWTKNKGVEEVAKDIMDQMIAHTEFNNSHVSDYNNRAYK